MNSLQTDNDLHYELKETIFNIDNTSDKNDIDMMMNSDSFFSDFKDEYDYFDNDNLIAQHIDYYENYNIKMLRHIATYYNIFKRKFKKNAIN